ncbi:MAG: cobaltochelatase subunit CobT [Pseudomonadota bacterium]
MTAADAKDSTKLFKQAVTSTMRAISGNEALKVSFGLGEAYMHGDRARLPLPELGLNESQLAALRGAADQLALQARFHDEAYHQKHRPLAGAAQEIFDWVENTRVDAIGSYLMRGVQDNLYARLEQRCISEGYQEITSVADAPLGAAVGMLLREKMTGAPLPDAAQNVLNLWREHLEKRIGDKLDELEDAMFDQAAFTDIAHHLIQELGLAVETNGENSDSPAEEELSSEETATEMQMDSDDSEQDDAADTGEGDGAAEGDEEETTSDLSSSEQLGEKDSKAEIPAPQQVLGDQLHGESDQDNYRVFSTEFDKTEFADALCEPDELAKLRGELDENLQNSQMIISKLANRLQRKLMAQQNRIWEFDLEEGMLDTARLSKVVTDPLSPLAFKQEKDTKFRDTVVSVLIDSSGSMRGRPMTIAAMCADILGSTLERCAVKVEILGFTTSTWRGGRSRELWLQHGKRPSKPGRLNDLLHVIYKAADMPWRRARQNLGLMMSDELLKENIDGEALLWAHNRIVGRPEERRILMVISDGLPVDNSTSLANSEMYLQDHLKSIIHEIEAHSDVELVAIGIGHDVTHYYRRAMTIKDVEMLGNAMIEKLVELFEEDTKLRRPTPMYSS